MMLPVSIDDEEKSVIIPFGSKFNISYRSKTNESLKTARMSAGVRKNHFIAEFDEDNVDFQIEMQNASEDRFVRFNLKVVKDTFAFATVMNSSWKIDQLNSNRKLHFRAASNREIEFDVDVEYSQPPNYSIYVSFGKSKNETLEVNRSLTVAELKEKIRRHYSIHFAYLYIFLEGNQLADELTMENLSIQEYSRLDVRGVVIPITVKILPNKPVTLEINTLDTVEDLKIKIEETEGIPVSKQHLYARGNEIADDTKFLGEILDKTIFLATEWKKYSHLLYFKNIPHECSPQSSFRVNVRHYGIVFSFDVCSLETVEELMDKVHDIGYAMALGDHPKCYLVRQATRLQNNLTLEVYDIKDGAHLEVHVLCTKDHHVCIGQEILIQRVSGNRTISLPYCGLETIKTVKFKINLKDGIPVDQQRLIFGGIELQNELTLNDYSICPDAHLHLVLRFSAGCGCGCSCGDDFDCKRYIVWKNWQSAFTNFNERPYHNLCLDRSIQIAPFSVELRLASDRPSS